MLNDNYIETSIGMLPSLWKISPLNNLVKTHNGLWTGKRGPFRSVKVIRNTNFNNDGTLDLMDVAELEVSAAQFETRQLIKGDIILERSGGGPTQPVGRVVYFHLDDIDFSFSNFTTRLRVVNKSESDALYLLFYLLHLYREGYTNALQSRTTGIRNLNFADYLQIHIPLPPLPEQRLIAHVLSTVRQSIEATERVIAAARELKRSLMKYLFTYGPVPIDQADQVVLKETEIGEVLEKWDVLTIVKFANVRGGKRLPKGHSFSDSQTTYPYIRVVDFDNWSVNKENLKYLTPKDHERIKRYIITCKDVYISIAGTIGLVGVVPKELDGANLTENAARIVLNDKQLVDNRYLTAYLASMSGQKEISIRTTKTSQPKLALTRIQQIPVPLPDFIEQRNIADKIASIDMKIQCEVKHKLSLEALFNSLLQNLMTGKIRVPPYANA